MQFFGLTGDPGYDTGYEIGRMVPFVLALIGILKCLEISRRPAANTKAALSLMMLFIVWTITMAVGALKLESKQSLLVMGAVVLVGITVTIMLAVLGLSEIRANPTQYTQGRRQAWWALGLSTCLVALVVAGAFAGMSNSRRRLEELETPVAQGAPQRFDDFNFQLTEAPRPWFPINSKKIAPISVTGLARSGPEMYFMIVAERLGVETTFDLNGYVEIVKAHLKSSAQSSAATPEKPVVINGLTGQRWSVRAQVSNLDLAYIYWVTQHNGAYYQLIAWAPQNYAGELETESAKVFDTFELIDKNKVYHTAGLKPVEPFHSPFGYSVEIKPGGWHEWADLKKDSQCAEFGAARGSYGCLIVVPVWLMGEDPPIEQLAHGLLKQLQVEYPDPDVHTRTIKEGALSGISFDFERTLSGSSYVYRFKILKGNGCGYLVAGWVLKDNEDKLKEVTAEMDQIKFDPAPAQLTLDKLSSDRRRTQGLVLNSIGLTYYRNKQFEQSLTWLKHAVESDPSGATTVTNAADAYAELGQKQQGLAFLKEHVGAIEDPSRVLLKIARLQRDLKDDDAAELSYASLFERGCDDAEALTEYVGLLQKHKRLDEALKRLDAQLGRKKTSALILLKANVLSSQNKHAEAIALLKDWAGTHDFNADLTYQLAEKYFLAQKYEEGLKACKDLLEHNADSTDSCLLKARCEYGLKWHREAKQTIEAGLKKDPNDPDLRDFLAQVSGALGEGDNSSVKQPIAPVPFPQELLTETPAPAPEGYLQDYDAYYPALIHARAYDAAGKTLRSTEFRSIRLVTADAIPHYNTLKFGFDPLSESIYVNSLEVKDADGKILSKGTVSDYYVTDDSYTDEASHRKLLHIPVSGLKADCRIEVMVTRNEHAPSGIPFDTKLFAGAVPIRRYAVVFKDDAGLNCEASAGLKERRIGDFRCFIQDNAPQYFVEPFEDDLQSFLPFVASGNKSNTWEAVGTKYLQSLTPLLEPSPELKAIAETEAAAQKTPTGKIAALARYVQRTYSYKAIEFGERALIPHSCKEILSNKFGDCKDHALLLTLLLRSQGIPAQLALVKAQGQLHQSLPALGQFDHMLVYLPEFNGGSFVDSTDKNSNVLANPPLGLAGRDALILESGKIRVARIPAETPGTDRVTMERTVELANDADVRVKESLEMIGEQAASMRSYLKRINPAHRRESLEEVLSSNTHPIVINDLTTEGLEEPEKPLKVNLVYVLKQKVQRVNEQVLVHAPSVWERYYGEIANVNKRKTPFRIDSDITLISKTALNLPEGYAGPDLAALKSARSAPGVDWALEPKLSGSTLTLDFKLHFTQTRQPASAYEGYQANTESALRALEQDIPLKKKQ